MHVTLIVSAKKDLQTAGPTEDAVGIQQIVQWAPGDYVQEILPHSTNNDSSQTDTSGREEEFAASLLQAFEAEGKLTIAETELSSSEDGVAELFNALSEKDITASTRGDDVTEEQHHSVRSEAESEDVEETSEVGFGTTTGGSGVEVTKEAKQQLQAEKAALHDASTEIATSIGQQHLRVFVAGLGPQYNLDILQALLEIDNPTDSEVSLKAEELSPVMLNSCSSKELDRCDQATTLEICVENLVP